MTCQDCGTKTTHEHQRCQHCYGLSMRTRAPGHLDRRLRILKGMMTRRRISYYRAQKEAGLAPATLRDLFNGKSQPRWSTVDALAEHLGLDRCDTCHGLGYLEGE